MLGGQETGTGREVVQFHPDREGATRRGARLRLREAAMGGHVTQVDVLTRGTRQTDSITQLQGALND